jgi:outer membrane protein TolC
LEGLRQRTYQLGIVQGGLNKSWQSRLLAKILAGKRAATGLLRSIHGDHVPRASFKNEKSMIRRIHSWRYLLIPFLMATTGCVPTQPFYLHESGDLSHYLDKATQTEIPDLEQQPLEEVSQAKSPFTLSRPEYDEIWELSVEDCVSIALANTKTIRGGTAARLQNGQLVSGTQEGSLVLNSVGRAFASSYDAAIVETNPGATSNFGPTTDGGVSNSRQGIAAALSDFDAQLSMTGNGPNGTFINHNDRPQNIPPGAAFGLPQVQTTNGGLTTQLSKKTVEGTVFTFRNQTNSDRGLTRPQSFQPLVSTWTTTLEVEARSPLLRGRGAQINRAPIVIARIATDVELMSIQAQVQDMLNNLEIRYWDLYLSYRTLETAKTGRDSALATWRIVYDKWQNGVEPVQAEAQAREQYFSFRASVESALRELYNNENELRLLMGIAATDGRLIRPKDEPTLARVDFDWTDINAEAIARRPELISKRWQIKQREMELIVSRNQLLPQLDLGAGYRWVGLGDDLIHAGRTTAEYPRVGSSAWQTLTGGDFQEFSVFFNYQMPIGFRKELAGVRHAQLRLAREKALLEDMELDVSVGMAKAYRNIDANYQLAQTNANRWAASQKEVESVEALYQGGKSTLDLVLEAQRRRAQGQIAFWNAVAEYNKSIADLHTRKGSILDYDGIAFEEGPWPQKAYWDAYGQARKRDASTQIDYGYTRPNVISRGSQPHGGPFPAEVPGQFLDGSVQGSGDGALEEVPTPAPVRPQLEPEMAPPMDPQMEPAPRPFTAPLIEEARASGVPNVSAAVASPAIGMGVNPLRSSRQAAGSVRQAQYEAAGAK